MNSRQHHRLQAFGMRNCRGVTLIEVLIGVLILSIGLLGLAGLQTASLRFNTSAYFRTQATSLAYDFADRLRANREAALDGDYEFDFQSPPPACVVAPVIAGTIAQQDIATWRNSLACALPLGTGRVALLDENEFTISVRWDESRGEAAGNEVFDEMTFVFTTRL
jgi:type IV pilus assembly protein PilV